MIRTIGAILFGFYIAVILVAMGRASAAGPEHVELAVKNSLSFNVETLVKCDWDGKKYRFQKTFLIAKRSITSIELPTTLRRCEVYSSIKLW